MNLRHVAWLLLAVGCLVPAGSVAHADDLPKNDVVNESYLFGYLTSSGNRLGIAWDPAAPTSEIGGPQDFTRSAASVVGSTVLQNTGAGGELVPVVEFESDPLTETLYLNASREFQVDLVGKAATGGCGLQGGGPAVEIYVGDEFVGGSFWGAITNHGWYGHAPAGYCLWAYRPHAEVDRLEAGAKLRLRIVYYSRFPADLAQDGIQYLMKGPNRSVVRIPVMSHNDVLLRLPEFQPGPAASAEPEAQQKDDPRSGWAVAGSAAPILMGLAATRGRPRTVLLVLGLLLAGGAAGCLAKAPSSGNETGEEGPPTEPSADVQIVDDEHTATNSPTRGSIFGIVQDDVDVPVVGAFVVLLRTSNFTRTDSFGRFSFDDVEPGPHRLRVDMTSYKSAEFDADVEPGRLTRVTVILIPTAPRDALPHRHDYWQGLPSKVWIEEDIRFENTQACPQVWLVFPLRGCEAHVTVPDPSTDGSTLVLPGTYDVEVSVTWNAQQNQVPWVSVGFVGNHFSEDEASAARGFWSQMYPKRNGVSTHLRSNWEMTDVGHQRFSTWDMNIVVPVMGVAQAAPMSGAFHVKVVMHKGLVPLEPAHPDFWTGKPSRQVLSQSVLKVECPPPPTPNCPTPSAYPDMSAGWSPIPLVPPGTARLHIVLEQDKKTEPNAYSWGLVYKPANLPPATGLAEYRKLTADGTSALRKDFNLTASSEETDPFYAKRSNWRFLLDDGHEGTRAVANGPITFKLTVTAFPRPDTVQAALPIALPK